MPNNRFLHRMEAAHAIYQEWVEDGMPDEVAIASALASCPGHTGHEFTPEEVRRGRCSCPACSWDRAAAPPPTPDSTR